MSNTQARVASALGAVPHQFATVQDRMPTLLVEREHLRACMLALQQQAGFESNTFVTAVDHFPADPRFELAYQFLSYAHNDRLRVHTRVSESDAKVPTISDLWPGTSFSERECFDMFGIVFEGHPDLRRLLMPAGFEHHPLRKDYPHHGIEPDRLYRTWDRERRKDWKPAT